MPLASAIQPATSTPASPPVLALEVLLPSAALIPLDETGWLRVTGDDRIRWLNGMATNSIQALTPGHGCYTFFLNAQGRIEGDATAFLLDDSILLQTQRSEVQPLLALLDRFIIMDDVELAAVESSAGLLLAGPQASALLTTLGLLSEPLDPLQLAHATWQGARIDLIHAHSPISPAYEIWGDRQALATLREQLLLAGAQLAGNASLEELRILAGIPRFGVDIRNSETARDLPQETGQTRALHFSKGCYLGQEIVERIRSRGNVHRLFSGFTLTGELPAAGALLFDEATPAKPIGELTSVLRLDTPNGPVQIALGYLRREVLDRGSRIQYPGGIAIPTAMPFALPRTPTSKRA